MSDNVCDVKLKKLRYLDKLRLSESAEASVYNETTRYKFAPIISINVHHVLINSIVLSFLFKIIVLSSSCHSCRLLVRLHIGPEINQ